MVATSAKDVDSAEVVKYIAHFLKKSGKVKLPECADLVKLGQSKELAPIDPDWYYIRCAAIARRLYSRPTGVGGLRKIYGGKLRRGVRPNHWIAGCGSVCRRALQTLEHLKWVEKGPEGKGRIISKQGRKDLDRIAADAKSKQVTEQY
ncbi:unnamed protein product, partial [Mesorhabditis belari]|uniref:40S ribosomal protein S19 n=1 Tax=Mesorhabditis belari TaxID=2138241 RepID=A0AAF3EXG7_9BILA